MSTKAYFSNMLFKTMIFAHLVLAWHIQCQQYEILQAIHVNRQKQIEHRLVGSIHEIQKQAIQPKKNEDIHNE